MGFLISAFTDRRFSTAPTAPFYFTTARCEPGRFRWETGVGPGWKRHITDHSGLFVRQVERQLAQDSRLSIFVMGKRNVQSAVGRSVEEPVAVRGLKMRPCARLL